MPPSETSSTAGVVVDSRNGRRLNRMASVRQTIRKGMTVQKKHVAPCFKFTLFISNTIAWVWCLDRWALPCLVHIWKNTSLIWFVFCDHCCLQLISCGLIAVGIYSRAVSSNFFDLSGFTTDPSVLLIVVGCVFFVVGLCGAIGSLRENVTILKVVRMAEKVRA